MKRQMYNAVSQRLKTDKYTHTSVASFFHSVHISSLQCHCCNWKALMYKNLNVYYLYSGKLCAVRCQGHGLVVDVTVLG